jgi:FAD/FMN-containing dehydrogenase
MALLRLRPGDDGYARACAGFNTAVVHAPEVVAVASSVEDVALAVRLARRDGQLVHAHATGHGARAAIRGGMLLATAGLDAVAVDAAARIATAGGGARAGALVAAAARHGLAPVVGSSATC